MFRMNLILGMRVPLLKLRTERPAADKNVFFYVKCMTVPAVVPERAQNKNRTENRSTRRAKRSETTTKANVSFIDWFDRLRVSFVSASVLFLATIPLSNFDYVYSNYLFIVRLDIDGR